MKRIVLGWMLAMCTAFAWALPSTQDVQQAVSRGDYAQAETMMQEVVAAKSGSANAHYVYAEILAHNGKFTLASDEARRASEIDPQTKFTDPAKFRAFQQLLEREQRPQARTPVSRGLDSTPAAPVAPAAAARSSQLPGIPGWVWIAGLAIVGYGAWKLMSRNSARANVAGPGYNNAAMAGGPGYGGGAMVPGNPAYGPGPAGYAPGGYAPGMQQGPGMGGGMLRTGVAVAGGLAAGALVNEMLHRGDGESSHAAGGAAAGAAAGAGTGLFDSVQPDTASAELENRPVDFGNDGWDSGSVDVGGGGSSDDGGWS